MQVEHQNGEYEEVGDPIFCTINFSDGKPKSEGYVQFFHVSRDTVLYLEGKPPGKKGEQFSGYPAKIIGIKYEPRPWWAFWRRRKPVGYYVRWE